MNTSILHRSVRAWALAGVVAGLGLAAGLACTPGSEITASESDVVATMHDQDFDFGTVTTYALSDSIVHVTDDGGDSQLISRDYDDEVVAQVAGKLDALGWTRVNDPVGDNPDVVVFLAATATANFSYYYYGYWGWYYPGYCPGCYWGYPTVMYSYTTGTLLIQMLNPDSADEADAKVTARWLAALNGVLDDSSANIQKRLTNGINQAFEQSPYLAGE